MWGRSYIRTAPNYKKQRVKTLQEKRFTVMGRAIKHKNTRLNKAVIKTVAISFLLLNISNLNAAKYAIIANSNSSINYDQKKIGMGFLKKTSIEDANGDTITPVGNSDTNAQKAFYKFTMGMSLDDIDSYWNTQIFSGGRTPIQIISAGNTGLDPSYLTLIHINKTPNSIGYIEYKYYLNANNSNKDKVKVLYTFEYPTTGEEKEDSGIGFFGLEKKKPQDETKNTQQAAQTKAEQQQKIAQQAAQQEKIVAQQQEDQEQAAQQKVKEAQKKAAIAKQKALDAEKAAQQQAQAAQQQAQEAMAKAQERIKQVNAELKAKAQARAKADAIQRERIQAAKARARAQAIAKAQQEAADAQRKAELAQKRAQAIEAQAKAQTQAAEQKAKEAEALLRAQGSNTKDTSYNPGPVVTVVKKSPNQSNNSISQASSVDNQDISSQIEQAMKKAKSIG